MFYYILFACSTYTGNVCLPPQYFTNSAACVRVGNAYAATQVGNARTRCVQIKRSDVR